MRSSALRHLVPLRLTLVGTHPEIWREVVVDHDLSLDHLRTMVQSLFEVFDCRHHIFTDSLESPGWSRTRRRWGDRWTMIDFRDPTIIDESTARVGTVMSGREPIYFTHSCDADWMVEIERGVDEMALASDPRSRVVGGERHSPFSCARGPYEFEVLVAVLDDPDHPDHALLRACLDAALGPWGIFDPAAVDIDAAQHTLTDAPDDTGTSATGVPQSLLHRLPRLAVPGLRRHLATAGIDLPIVVTADDAATLTCNFRWLIHVADRGGVPLRDGKVDRAFVEEGCEALHHDERYVLGLVAAARRMRLLYSRNGRLVPRKAVVAAAASATTLWTTLADGVAALSVVPAATRDLLLLTLADGSLARDGGVAASAAAALTESGRARRVSPSDWRYDDFVSRRSYMYADQDCRRGCDCPTVDGRTWHDVVARAIRSAAAAAGSDASVVVAATMDADELASAGVRPEWVAHASTCHADHLDPQDADFASSVGDHEHDHGAALISEAADLIEILTLFGLEGDASGWVVPPALQEFARAALQSASAWRYPDAF
ncbi:hypothetical protein [Microbacterium sp. NPDC056569]|uniref:IS1096 element passenger TnpR family protein n=1 Tax=Microbacterium sp. NPDC056569 TaxID=3345867 RepID=UPI00366F3588